LVEGDVIISKTSLGGSGEPRPQFQWTTDVLVGSSQVQNITADLGGLASQPAWQTAARQALVEWNRVNCSSVRLVEASPGDITFSTFSTFPNVAAAASFPVDAPPGSGKPGPTIRVNVSYTGSPNNSSTKFRNMVHEIGHTVGFRHTNWQSQGEPQSPPGANLVPGTPQTDAASVMNGGTATSSWSGFSTYDTVATRTRYPGGLCVQPITGSATMSAGNTCYYYASATGGVAPYTFTWSWTTTDGGSVGGYSPANGTFLLAAQSSYGTVKLAVTATDAAGGAGTGLKTITISPLYPCNH